MLNKKIDVVRGSDVVRESYFPAEQRCYPAIEDRLGSQIEIHDLEGEIKMHRLNLQERNELKEMCL